MDSAGNRITSTVTAKMAMQYGTTRLNTSASFTSEEIVHPQVDGQSVTVDITGCRELKIVFLCDYEVSTAENGYCYHGICNPTLTKIIEESIGEKGE